MRGIATAALGLIVLALATASAPAQPGNPPDGAVERAYTPLDLAQCRHTKGKAEEDYGSWRCAGHTGIAVFVSAGDQRTYISYGPNAAKELAAEQTLAAFNSQGKTIEWRIERRANGKPRAFATILRWSTTTQDENTDPVRGQVLVVTRLGPGGVCHVGYVDGRANPNANELARQIADNHARGFKYGTDKPMVLGAKGKGFSGPMAGTSDTAAQKTKPGQGRARSRYSGRVLVVPEF